MARLPTVAGDNDAWGDVLNDFLSVAHNSDGTLKASGISALQRAEDPRSAPSYVVGAADNSAALQETFDAAGVGGAVELPELTINYQSTLTVPEKMELRGTSMEGSVLQTSLDIVGLFAVGGEGRHFKNFKLANSFTGTRTTHDIEICNPYKPVIDHVKIALSQSSLVKGGIRLYKDVGQPNSDRCFMPVLDDVWIANGVLVIDDVTDGKMHGGFVWATYTGATGGIQCDSSNWTFVDVDIVPPQGDAGCYLIGELSELSIIGGLMDGSYDDIMTGHGIKSNGYVRGATIQGVKFYNLGRSGIKLNDVRRSTFSGNVFVQNNKADNSYADIDITAGAENVFALNTHGAPNSRTNKGKIYVEDATSANNIIDYNVMELNGGTHFYASPLATVAGSGSTLGKHNKPAASWPVSTIIARTSTYTITTADIFNGYTIMCTSGTFTVTLPSVNAVHAGDDVIIKNTGAGTITIATTSSQTIDGSTTQTLTANLAMRIMSTGAGTWAIVGKV